MISLNLIFGIPLDRSGLGCVFALTSSYHSLAPMYYRGAKGALVIYDITSRVAFSVFGSYRIDHFCSCQELGHRAEAELWLFPSCLTSSRKPRYGNCSRRQQVRSGDERECRAGAQFVARSPQGAGRGIRKGEQHHLHGSVRQDEGEHRPHLRNDRFGCADRLTCSPSPAPHAHAGALARRDADRGPRARRGEERLL